MSDPTRRTRGDELLLARISAAAGRERLGRRRATYAAAAHTARAAHAKALLAPGIRGLLALVRHGGSAGAATARDAARLDLYENGMTVAVKNRNRIHVVRYDTTSVFRTEAARAAGTGHAGAACALTDVDGERVVLRHGPERGEAPDWWPEIEQGVARAQLPRALAALARGERLAFGGVWLTGEEIGWGEARARWPLVRRLRTGPGAARLDVDGTWHELAPAGPGIPNLFVLRALVERLGGGEAR